MRERRARADWIVDVRDELGVGRVRLEQQIHEVRVARVHRQVHDGLARRVDERAHDRDRTAAGQLHHEVAERDHSVLDQRRVLRDRTLQLRFELVVVALRQAIRKVGGEHGANLADLVLEAVQLASIAHERDDAGRGASERENDLDHIYWVACESR